MCLNLWNSRLIDQRGLLVVPKNHSWSVAKAVAKCISPENFDRNLGSNTQAAIWVAIPQAGMRSKGVPRLLRQSPLCMILCHSFQLHYWALFCFRFSFRVTNVLQETQPCTFINLQLQENSTPIVVTPLILAQMGCYSTSQPLNHRFSNTRTIPIPSHAHSSSTRMWIKQLAN